jgi:hypothetical protein
LPAAIGPARQATPRNREILLGEKLLLTRCKDETSVAVDADQIEGDKFRVRGFWLHNILRHSKVAACQRRVGTRSGCRHVANDTQNTTTRRKAKTGPAACQTGARLW